ncbi:MAG: hypothetical protein V1895_02745 [Parcubacteria group bacterium]
MTWQILQTILLDLLVVLIGYGGIVWFTRRLRLNLLLVGGMSFAVGAALVSGMAVILLLAEQFELVIPILLGLAGISLVSIAVAWFCRRTRRSLVASLRPHKEELVLIVLSLPVLIPLLLHSLLTPLSAWDAKMIWLPKAKALYSEPRIPNTLFASDLFGPSHKDYPLGLPALSATHFAWYGGVSEQPVVLTYVLFYWSIVLILVGAARHFIKGRTLLVGAIIIAIFAAGDLFAYAGLGLADVPLALYFLIALLALCGAVNSTDDSAATTTWLGLGVIATLGSALYKNEANLFLVLYLLATGGLLFYLRHKNKKWTGWSRGRIIGQVLLAGLLAAPSLWWTQRCSSLGYISDLFLTDGAQHPLSYYFDRAIQTANWFAKEVTSFEHWGWALLPALLLGVAGVVWLLRIRPRRWIVLLPLAVITAQLTGYFVIYVVSPQDLTWHITTSLDRLFVQIVPALYLCVGYLWLQLLYRPQPRV